MPSLTATALLPSRRAAEGFTDGTGQLEVTDDDVATLTLSIADPSISENDGTTTVTVSRNTETESELIVDLLSDDTSEATFSGTFTIPSGEVSATFTLTAVDDMQSLTATRQSPSPQAPRDSQTALPRSTSPMTMSQP